MYPGSFDPITFGHIDIAKRALKVFDCLVILISDNPQKEGLFTAEERKAMVERVFVDYKDHVEVVISHDLTVNKTESLGASHIVRGLRAVTDFEYEFQLTHANRALNKSIDSVFFMTDNRYSFLSSTTVKEIAKFGGELGPFLPDFIVEEVEKKMHK